MTIGIFPPIQWTFSKMSSEALNGFKHLTEPVALNSAQDTQLKALFEEEGDIYSCRFIKDKKLLKKDPVQQCHAGILKALATFVLIKDEVVQWRAAHELLEARKIPGANVILSEIAQSHPIPAIMERAAQIMAAPELPEGYPLSVGVIDWVHPRF